MSQCGSCYVRGYERFSLKQDVLKDGVCLWCLQYNRLSRSGEMNFGRIEFLDWMTAHGGTCTFCGVEPDVVWWFMGGSETLEMTRIDESLDYGFDNVVACCSVCKKVRAAGGFDFWQMMTVGESIGSVWSMRLKHMGGLSTEKVQEAKYRLSKSKEK